MCERRSDVVTFIDSRINCIKIIVIELGFEKVYILFYYGLSHLISLSINGKNNDDDDLKRFYIFSFFAFK